MSAIRSRKEEKLYKRYRKKLGTGVCQFCAVGKEDTHYLRASRSFKIIRNIFAYSIWDGQRVVDHLLVIPKKHVDSLGDLSASEASELLKIFNEYEKEGYNVYARAPTSAIKSVIHQHTHLIKTAGAPKKFIFLLRKPYIRIIAG